MKIWICTLTIAFVILKIVEKCIINYIKNDKEECMKYYATGGTSNLGIIYGFVYMITTLVGASDIILFIILLLNKI